MLAQHFAAALSGDGTGVHQARVASRRLRETLPLAAAVITPRVARHAARLLRRLTTTLGAVRELDVARTVTAESVADPVLRADIDALIVARRDGARAALVETWNPRRVARLWRRLTAVTSALSAVEDDEKAIQKWHRELAQRLARRADDLIVCGQHATMVYDIEKLHAIRIACKKLRYALEIACDLQVVTAARALKTLKKHQDTLGHLHDLDVLAAHAVLVPSRALPAAQAAWARDAHAHHARHLRGRSALLRVADLVHDRLAPRIREKTPHAAITRRAR